MTQAPNRGLRVLLLPVGGSAGAMIAFALASLFLKYVNAITADPTQTTIVVTSLALIGALSLPAVYHGYRSLQGASRAAAIPGGIGVGQLAIALVVWLGSLWGVQAAVDSDSPSWWASLAHLLGIGIPIYLLIRFVTARLRAISAARRWGLLTAGMWLGTGLATLAEGALGVVALLLLGAYLLMHPSELALLQRLAQGFSGTNALPDALDALRPLLDRPLVLLLGLVGFGAIVPAIEESAKSTATWILFDHLLAPADGFVAGALAGAGFGLIEGLFASASPDAFSAATLVARAGSSLMHIAAGAWAGKGIADFRLTRSIGSLLRGYGAALATHGLWNASVVLIAFAGLYMGVVPLLSNYLALGMMLLGGIMLAGLCSSTAIALVITRSRLRAHSLLGTPSSAIPAALDPSAVDQVQRAGK